MRRTSLDGSRGQSFFERCPAWHSLEEMTFEEIATEDGVRNIMSRLKEFCLPHLEVSLPRAFETAVYGKARQSSEGFPEYIARMEKAFSRLSKEGVDLPEGTSGYILYRQASLSEAQDQRLLTWCDGKYDKSSIVKALRKLDRVIKETKGKSSYIIDTEDAFENKAYIQAEEEDGEDYIFVAEGDLDAIYSHNLRSLSTRFPRPFTVLVGVREWGQYHFVG